MKRHPTNKSMGILKKVGTGKVPGNRNYCDEDCLNCKYDDCIILSRKRGHHFANDINVARKNL